MRFGRNDVVTIIGLVLVALAIRLPFRSQYLFHWDSVNFALSLETYDVRLHQPHPPGYFLYSAIGSGLNYFLHDANASLTWMSLISGMLGVGAIYWLGSVMFNRSIGLAAALLTLTNPLHWFYSDVALSYSLEFLLVTLIAGLCYLQYSGSKRLWPWLAVLVGAAGGVRQNDILFMLPLWLLSLSVLSWRQRVGSLILLGLVCVLWAAPMVVLSGGISGYLAALRGGSEGIAQESMFAAFNQLFLNVGRMAVYLGYGLLLTILPLIWVTWRFMRAPSQYLADRRTRVLALWILPALAFYLVVHLRQHGHIFTFLPAIILVSAVAAVELARRLGGRSANKAVRAMVGVLAVTNALFFLLVTASLLGMRQLPLQTPSRATIVERDRFLGARITAIRANFEPSSTAILAGSLNFRHPDFYLRDYQNVVSLADTGEALPTSIQTVVLFDDMVLPDLSTDINLELLPLPDGDMLRYLKRKDKDEIIIVSSSGIEIIARTGG